MPSHTLMARFASESAAREFESWLHHSGHASTTRAGADVTVALRSPMAWDSVRAEAERRGGEVAWEEDDSGDIASAL